MIQDMQKDRVVVMEKVAKYWLPPRLRETLNDFRGDTASRQIRGTPNPVLKSAEKYTLKELLFELLVCIAGL